MKRSHDSKAAYQMARHLMRLARGQGDRDSTKLYA